MENQRPTSEEFEVYEKVSRYLDRKIDKTSDNRFSIIPKPKWLMIIVLAIITCLCYYGLTTLLFGEDFWVRTITGNQDK